MHAHRTVHRSKSSRTAHVLGAFSSESTAHRRVMASFWRPSAPSRAARVLDLAATRGARAHLP
jgi:hypothetical protein